METENSWDILRRIENIIINYGWSKYSTDVGEAYSVWRGCYHFARKKQLKKHSAKSLASLLPNRYNDYEDAMMQRIAFAITSYLDSYVRYKLPKEVSSGFETILLVHGLEGYKSLTEKYRQRIDY